MVIFPFLTIMTNFAFQLQNILTNFVRFFKATIIISGKNMKITSFLSLAVAATVLFSACGSHGHTHEHEHVHSHEAGHDHDSETGHDHEKASGHSHEHEDGIINFSVEQAKMAGVKTETLTLGTFAEVVRVSGQVLAAQGDESAVVARTSGILTFTRDHLSEGSEVRNGEVLAKVSGQNIVGGDAVAQSNLLLATAEAAYQRAERLIADSIISQKEFERAKMEYESARLAAKVGSGDSGGAVVTAPIKGFIKQVLVKQGEYVEAGQIIATVTKSCNLQLRAEVPEKYFSILNKVRSANFKMGYDNEARSLDVMGGHLVAIGKIANEGSAYIPVTFEFANTGSVVPGAFADIWLIMHSRDNVLTIPVSALSEAQGVFYAYIKHADEDDCYERRELRIGASDGRRVEVLSGLSEGDNVVVSGVSQVKMAGATGAIPDAHNHSH